jgi:FlaA1/EpsC-like NDP-sugar epimerase
MAPVKRASGCSEACGLICALQSLACSTTIPSFGAARCRTCPSTGQIKLEALISKQRIRQVLLAMPSAPLSRCSQLVRQLKAMGLEMMVMPSLAQIASGENSVSELRPVAIEELLRREPSEPIPGLLQAAV